jgi:hypothetical protein
MYEIAARWNASSTYDGLFNAIIVSPSLSPDTSLEKKASFCDDEDNIYKSMTL